MTEDYLRRRGGSTQGRPRARDVDRRAGASRRGAALVGHFLSRDPAAVDRLMEDLDVRRRHVKLLDLSAAQLERRLASHGACLPDDLLLLVRFSTKHDCLLDADARARLAARTRFGSPERDVGRFPLIQVCELAAPDNRVRTGRSTAMVRAALGAVRATRALSQELLA